MSISLPVVPVWYPRISAADLVKFHLGQYELTQCLQKQKQVKNEIKDIFKSNPEENKFASKQDP
ncbi:MAG: hypothetical protein ACPIEU_09210, partial [Candidatus Puniceispirillaceae bacterium]